MKALEQVLLTEINDNWDALVSVASQTLESDGVFFVDPDLGDLEVPKISQ